MIGQSLLTFQELGEVLLDVEMTMNNRPLMYQGEEFEKPVLTPNTLLRGEAIPILEEDLEVGGEDTKWKPNPEAEVFVPRVGPSRRAKEVADNLFRNIAGQEFEHE